MVFMDGPKQRCNQHQQFKIYYKYLTVVWSPSRFKKLGHHTQKQFRVSALITYFTGQFKATQQKKTCYADGEKGVDLVGELYRFRSKGQGEQWT
jgi:hypothetical protein